MQCGVTGVCVSVSLTHTGDAPKRLAEPIEMPFRGRFASLVGPRYNVLTL